MPLLPGLFPSASRSWPQCGLMKGCHYLNDIHAPAQPQSLAWADRDLLFSFVGRGRTHPLRARLLSVERPRAWLANTDPEAPHEVRPTACRGGAPCDYCQVLRRSRFVLCPRGFGPSSYRIFEAMEWGCVPVILSDDWTAPAGAPWASCSLQIPERSIGQMVAMLEDAESRSESMGQAARAAWEQWFSPTQTWTFFRLALEELQAERAAAGWSYHLGQMRHQLAPFHLKALAGTTGRAMFSLFRRNARVGARIH